MKIATTTVTTDPSSVSKRPQGMSFSSIPLSTTALCWKKSIQGAIAARAINLPQDREIIHVLPQSFVVDDGDGVREPIGMSGVRLEVEVHIVTGTVTSVQNVVRSVNRAGLAVQDIVLEPLASAEAVLFDDEKALRALFG